MRPLFSGLILLVLLLTALYVPVHLPYQAESIGKVQPAQEWQLLQDQTGRLTSVVRDHKSGAALQINAFQFEQGDFSGLKIDLPPGAFVHAGDTVVRMFSTRQLQEIQSIEAQLTLYAAQLNAEKTGDKAPIVQEAENKLHFSEQDLSLKESLYQTKKRLKDEGLIAVTEFQTAENDFHLAKIQVEIARKNLETVRTGLKSESVGITEAQLKGLRDRLALLRQKGLSFVLLAPFSGYVAPSLPPEQLLVLHRADEYLVQIPVKVEQLGYYQPGVSKIEITDVKTKRTFHGDMIGSQPNIEVLDNRQVAILTASVRPDSLETRLSIGIASRCVIDFGRVNQREYLKRTLNIQW